MKLHHHIRSSRRKPFTSLPRLTALSGVFALAMYLSSADSANAVMVDDNAPSLLTALNTGDTPFSLGTGLDDVAANAPAISLASYPRAGWQAILSTNAHGVRGTVTIVDADTFRVDNFFYDGGGIDVHFILAASNNNSVFSTARLVADSLPSPGFRGTAYTGGSVTIDLPAGQTLDGYNAVSLWCIPAGANFGSGTFVNTVPEPGSAVMLSLGAMVLGGFARRRPTQAESL